MPLIRMTGVFGIPLALLTVTIAVLVVRAALSVRRGRPSTALFALLFWGFAAAVLGFLGQCIGLYNGLTAVSHATEIDPRIVSQGLAQSFSTTIWGGALLVLAGASWLVLRTVEGRTSVRSGVST